MSKTLTIDRLEQERIVRLKEHIACVQGLDGSTLPGGKVEAGIVREISDKGGVLVRWLPADIDAWMEPEELEPRDPGTHLIAIYKVDGDELRTFDRYMTAATAGLDHNWTIEHWPANVVRAIRS